MDSADHRPLASDLFETAEEKLSETSGTFLLSEDRLDHLFAQSVSAAPSGSSYLVRHRLHQRRAFQDTPGSGVSACAFRWIVITDSV
jgi:hypothetical protein